MGTSIFLTLLCIGVHVTWVCVFYLSVSLMGLYCICAGITCVLYVFAPEIYVFGRYMCSLTSDNCHCVLSWTRPMEERLIVSQNG